ESLTVLGIVTVHAGEDMAPWRQTSLGPELYWLRILWTAGEFGCLPDLARVLLNTVPATHTVTLQNELLGSSNGKPRQTFRTARRPVLHDLFLEVREPDMPGPDELASIRATYGVDATTPIIDPQGRVEAVWVRWHEVGDWRVCPPTPPHFGLESDAREDMVGVVQQRAS